jgi:hypothetical protein
MDDAVGVLDAAPVDVLPGRNSLGGKLEGACDKAGTIMGEPYEADYWFLKKK